MQQLSKNVKRITMKIAYIKQTNKKMKGLLLFIVAEDPLWHCDWLCLTADALLKLLFCFFNKQKEKAAQHVHQLNRKLFVVSCTERSSIFVFHWVLLLLLLPQLFSRQVNIGTLFALTFFERGTPRCAIAAVSIRHQEHHRVSRVHKERSTFSSGRQTSNEPANQRKSWRWQDNWKSVVYLALSLLF